MDTTPKSKKAMTKDEVLYLVELIQGNSILTSKETNATTNKLKEDAWVSVTDAYNAKRGSIPRHKDQLKLKWDNLKKAARKRAQQIRMNSLKTGGGKPDYIPPDEILEKVAGLLGSTCTGFIVPFGGDGVCGSEQVLELEVGGLDDRPLLQEEINFEDDKVSNDEALCPSTSGAKKRKIVVGRLEPGIEDGNVAPKFLFGMPNMAKCLQNAGRKKKEKQDDGRLQRNLAMARYYDKKTEKLEIEIELLRMQLANKSNNN